MGKKSKRRSTTPNEHAGERKKRGAAKRILHYFLSVVKDNPSKALGLEKELQCAMTILSPPIDQPDAKLLHSVLSSVVDAHKAMYDEKGKGNSNPNKNNDNDNNNDDDGEGEGEDDGESRCKECLAYIEMLTNLRVYFMKYEEFEERLSMYYKTIATCLYFRRFQRAVKAFEDVRPRFQQCYDRDSTNYQSFEEKCPNFMGKGMCSDHAVESFILIFCCKIETMCQSSDHSRDILHLFLDDIETCWTKPGRNFAYTTLASNARSNGEYRLAVQYVEKQLAIHPATRKTKTNWTMNRNKQLVLLLVQLAEDCGRVGEHKRAIELFKRARRVDISGLSAYEQYQHTMPLMKAFGGEYLRYRGNEGVVLKLYQEYFASVPPHELKKVRAFGCFRMLATAHYDLREWDTAIRILKETIECSYVEGVPLPGQEKEMERARCNLFLAHALFSAAIDSTATKSPRERHDMIQDAAESVKVFYDVLGDAAYDKPRDSLVSNSEHYEVDLLIACAQTEITTTNANANANSNNHTDANANTDIDSGRDLKAMVHTYIDGELNRFNDSALFCHCCGQRDGESINLMKCSGCKAKFYCSVRHQGMQFKCRYIDHKLVCPFLSRWRRVTKNQEKGKMTKDSLELIVDDFIAEIKRHYGMAELLSV